MAVDSALRERSGRREDDLLAVFDFFGDWLDQAVTQAHASPGPQPALRGATGSDCLADASARLAELAGRAGLQDPEGFARSLHILLHGLDISAAEGEPRAAGHARRIAALLVQEHLRTLP